MSMEMLQSLLNSGGPVLVFFIIPVMFLMFVVIMERFFYFRLAHNQVADAARDEWNSRSDKTSIKAGWVRDKLVTQIRGKAEQNVSLARALVSLAPLLGLLGTVTGMVFVFDAVAISGGSDAKGLSAGVAQATIPTMAGMVTSICGLPFTMEMQAKVERLVQEFESSLRAA